MCAGKLFSLIKKCLHREKTGQKSDSSNFNPTHKTGQKSPDSPSKKNPRSSSSPKTGQCCCYCCCSCYYQKTQQIPASMDRTGYQKMCPGPAGLGQGQGGQHGVQTHGGQTHGVQTHGHTGTHGCGYTNTPNPVVYVPGTPMDRVEREVALQRERQMMLQNVQTDMELNLPPAIRISEDGEEGYAHSQRTLQISCDQRRGESIRPPPNKTVFQGDSPPPYRSNSVSKLDGHYCQRRSGNSSASGGGTHQQHNYPQSCLANKMSCNGNNSPHIARCHSMSSSGDKRLLPTHPSHHGRQSMLPSCGHYLNHGSHGHPCSHSSSSHTSSPCHHHPPAPSSLSSQPSGMLGHSHSHGGPGGHVATTTHTLSTAASGTMIVQREATPTNPSNNNTLCHGNHNPSDNSHYGPPPDYCQVVREAAVQRTQLVDSKPLQNQSNCSGL